VLPNTHNSTKLAAQIPSLYKFGGRIISYVLTNLQAVSSLLEFRASLNDRYELINLKTLGDCSVF